MIFLIVLNRFRIAMDWSGLIVLIVLFGSRKCSVDLSMTGMFLVASGEIFSSGAKHNQTSEIVSLKSAIIELLECLKSWFD